MAKFSILLFTLGCVLLESHLSQAVTSDHEYVFKLLQSLDLSDNPASNKAISPVALKLSLLSLASVTKDTAVQDSITRFLFGTEQPSFREISHAYNPNYERFPFLDFAMVAQRDANKTDGGIGFQNTGPHPSRRHYEFLRHYLSSWSQETEHQDQIWKVCERFDKKTAAAVHNSAPNVIDCLEYFLNNQSSHAHVKHLEKLQNVKLCSVFRLDTYWSNCEQFIRAQDPYNQDPPHQFTWKDLYHLLGNVRNERLEGSSYYFQMDRLWFEKSAKKFYDAEVLKNVSKIFNIQNFGVNYVENVKNWQMAKTELSTFGIALDHIVPVNHEFLDVLLFSQRFKQTFINLGRQQFFHGPKGDEHAAHFVDKLTLYGNFGLELIPAKGHEKSHTLVQIPYANEKYSLVILMPSEDSSVPEMLANLTSKEFDRYLRVVHSWEEKVKLTIPRFRINSQMHLSQILHKQNFISNHALFPEFHQLIQLTNYGTQDKEYSFVDSSKVRPQVYSANQDPGATSQTQTLIQQDQVIPDVVIDRPFVYFVVGKFLSLHLQPQFEVLITGVYNRPDSSECNL